MSKDELNRLMAEKAMGWQDGKDPMHGLDCWNNSLGFCMRLKKDWNPCDNIAQARDCLKKWQSQSTCNLASIELQYGDMPPTIIQVWEVKLFEMDTKVSYCANVSLSFAIVTAIAEAIGENDE